MAPSFRKDPSPAEEQRDTLARAMREIANRLVTLAVLGGVSASGAKSIAAQLRTALEDAGLEP